MENSILNSTKAILGLNSDYDAFDLDVITHINTAFSNLHQLGIVAAEGFAIEDDTALWGTLDLPTYQLSMVRTYVFLKTRSLFDPPTTSYLIEATTNQINELEWRLTNSRDIDWTDNRTIAEVEGHG